MDESPTEDDLNAENNEGDAPSQASTRQVKATQHEAII